MTDMLLQHTWPFMRGVAFNRNEEGKTGADWLWWWLEKDAAFGMLIQAKRLKPPKWTADFGYKDGQQWARLVDAAKALNVAPVYAVYTGTPESRGDLSCGRSDHTGDCEWCRAATVTLFPANAAEYLARFDAPFELSSTVPLEFLTDADLGPRPLRVRADLPEPLRSFLTSKHDGVLSVAKSLVSIVMNVRERQFGVMTDTAVCENVTDDPYFSHLPSDQGHMSDQVFPNILRGLRRTPPGYVLDVLHGNPIQTDLPGKVDGVVVLDLDTSQG
ncbi:hypothetical protein ACPCUX_05570 [Cellulosimicrobium sp. AB352]|uniref:hypothetical protein n=1 Tax=Cellulosimicrobium sp. AB352 TaxID=3413281 RepID=UPI003C14A57A